MTRSVKSLGSMSKLINYIKSSRNIYSITEDEKRLLLFHGSYETVPLPSVSRSIKCSECGPGFYTFLTPIGAHRHRGRYASIISCYVLDAERLESEKKISYKTQHSIVANEVVKYGNVCNVYTSLFKIDNGSSSFVYGYGGQFYTNNQQFLDTYVRYIGGGRLEDVVIALDIKDETHIVKPHKPYTALLDVEEVIRYFGTSMQSYLTGTWTSELDDNEMWQSIKSKPALSEGIVRKCEDIRLSFRL